ncbi:TIGR01777 family oxidoreductase [Kiritimatiella glycovorans]|uniref:Epimerase family protein n=1 Tax=Kiritimatiella glycovorans TaxID=1307763 RepID=A0A0G3EEX4_9BACT|nr:TIGR01777 family oxidoreductase [Kiritimatiella glycovorans]AKJ64863.1 Epimerase family protein [Kiritimatiella glycovorans]
MNVLMTGGSGLIGSAVTRALRSRGDRVMLMSHRAGSGDLTWSPEEGAGPGRWPEADAVVHFAGTPVAGRWTKNRRRSIRDSRVNGARLLAAAVAEGSLKTSRIVSASAVGYYGDRGDEELDESAPPGEGFLATVCQEWEDAWAPAEDAGVAVARMRFGIVLSGRGGALPPMLRAARFGLPVRLGSGSQFMSWIGLADAVRAALWLLDHPEVGPVVNAAAPNPVRNTEWAERLRERTGGPFVTSAPAPLLKLAAGDMAREMLLASVRAVPKTLEDGGFTFGTPGLAEALDADE